jgi:hypothetical protein
MTSSSPLERGPSSRFTARDVLDLLSVSDGDYHDGIYAYVSVRIEDDGAVVTLTDPATNESESFSVTATKGST